MVENPGHPSTFHEANSLRLIVGHEPRRFVSDYCFYNYEYLKYLIQLPILLWFIYMKLFPLPYSSELHNSKAQLSWHSQVVLLATMQYVKQQPDAEIILIGEQTYGSTTHKTVEPMKEFLLAHGFPETQIIYNEKVCNNTYLQLQELKKEILDDPITLVAFKFHAKRIKLIGSRVGLRFSIRTVEDIVKNSEGLRSMQHSLNKQPFFIKAYELFLYLLALLDTRGAFQNWYSKKFGPRAPLV